MWFKFSWVGFFCPFCSWPSSIYSMLLCCHYGSLAAEIKFLPVLSPGKMSFCNTLWQETCKCELCLESGSVIAQWESACLHINACGMAAVTNNILSLHFAACKRHGRTGVMCRYPTAEIMSWMQCELLYFGNRKTDLPTELSRKILRTNSAELDSFLLDKPKPVKVQWDSR